MKVIAITGVVAMLVIVAMYAIPSTTEVVHTEPTVVEKEVQVDALEKAIREAQDARRADIESIAKKAYDEAYNQEMKKTELEVIKAFGEKLDARQVELEKDTGEY